MTEEERIPVTETVGGGMSLLILGGKEETTVEIRTIRRPVMRYVKLSPLLTIP